ncbi:MULTISPECIES: hypothetical protein [unclassified Legionella]|uniref:hypothetical protein n=1 Tax=unclassified Legionella TaxID=2622702 RepID=UPI0010549949|nr:MULTISPECIES: hypothetical protein [unclassified Legionella]MDI9819736.1 hypothetical protein [Legionella sp. PL877]
MTKNKDFLTALQSQNLETHKGAAYKDALDGMLKVDPVAEPDKFRTAIFDKKDFWSGLNGLDLSGINNDESFLAADGANNLSSWRTWANRDPQPTQTFSVFRQLAAEKRITLGISALALDDADSEQLLKAILQPPADATQVRGVIASADEKFFGNFANHPGWAPDTETLLTNDAINNIKEAAKTRLQALAQEKVNQKLKDASEAQLQDIIKASNFSEVRTQLATLATELASYPAWDVTTGDVILDGTAGNIQKQAQQLLLLQQIKKSNNLLLIDLLNADDANKMISAVEALGIPHDVAVKINDPAADHLKEAREEAFLLVAKNKLAALNSVALGNIVNGNINDVVQGAKDLLGSNAAPIDNLFGGSLDTPFSKIFRAHAAIEKHIRDNQEINLSKAGYDGLKDKINNPDAIDLIKDLPAKDKQNFQAKMVENLVKNYPADKPLANLEQLAGARTINQFNTALTGLGVTAQDWVSQDSMKIVQKAACTNALKHEIANYSQFKNRPHLVALVSALSLEMQQALLRNPQALRSLMNVQSDEKDTEKKKTELRAKINFILAGNSGIKDDALNTLAINLAEENKGLAAFNNIANPEVARILADFTPAINLDQTMIDNINNVLLNAAPNNFDPPPGSLEYAQRVGAIAAAINQPADALVFTAFGLTGNDNTATLEPKNGGVISNKVKTQHDFNQYLIAAYAPSPSASDKAILQQLMALPKKKAFPNEIEKIDGAIAAFKKAPTLAVFIKELEKSPSAAGVFDAEAIKKQLTPEAFQAAKIAAGKKAFEVAKTAPDIETAVKALIKAQKAEVRSYIDRHNEIEETDRDVRDQILFLGTNDKATDLLNPIFEATAKERAERLAPLYRDVDEISSSMMQVFSQELKVLEAQQASLSDLDIPAAKEAIAARRKELAAQIEQAENGYQHYKQIHDKLHGEAGILEVLEAAKAGRASMKMLTGHIRKVTSANDYDLSEKAALLRSAEVDQVPGVSSDVNSITINTPAPLLYSRDDKDILEPGKLRRHSVACQVGNKEYTGSYLEERGAGNVKPEKRGDRVEFNPSMAYTVSNKPADAMGRFILAMEMAGNLTKSLSRPPTEQNPIVISETDPEMAKHIWTAFMIIGKSDPNMKFDNRHIKCTAGFRPEQNGFRARKWPKYSESFAETSLFEQVKEQANCQQIIAAVLTPLEKVNEDKFGKKDAAKTEEQQIIKAAEKVGSTMKDKLEELKRGTSDAPAAVEEDLPTISRGPGT